MSAARPPFDTKVMLDVIVVILAANCRNKRQIRGRAGPARCWRSTARGIVAGYFSIWRAQKRESHVDRLGPSLTTPHPDQQQRHDGMQRNARPQ
jgi:hypothetical protein